MWRIFLLALISTTIKAFENVNLKQDWWETAVFYEIYTRSFMDSDGDGIGDINGVTSRLEYLKEIGVDATILSPIFKSSMHDFGYDISDYYSIHPEYGNIEDLEQLLTKANELNIKIVLDFVPNHTSNESEWFIRSANRDEYYNDWYIWESGYIDSNGKKQPPNNWISLFRKSAWTYSSSRDQYYLHQFSAAQPDLNYRNPVVVEEIKNVLKYWLEKGIAGMRMSSVNHIFETDKDGFGGRYPDEPLTGKPGLSSDDYNYLNHVYTKDQEDTYDLVSQLAEVFDSITLRNNLTRIMMTEARTNIKNAVRYYGDNVHAGAHVPLNFALIENVNKDSDARDIKYAVDRWLTYKPLGKPANWMTGNYDLSRVASRFRPGLVDAFNMLVLLLPGIAIVYMGEEIGMANSFVPWSDTKDPLACNTDDPVNYVEVSRDPIRTPFQWNNGKNAGFSGADEIWLPVAEGFENVNVATQRSSVRSHYQVYRTLMNLRMRPAFRYGRYESLALGTDVFAFKSDIKMEWVHKQNQIAVIGLMIFCARHLTPIFRPKISHNFRTRWYNHDTYIVLMNFGRTDQMVNLTAFDLIFGQLEIEVSSVLSSRTYSDNVQAKYVDLSADEALVLRMQV